MCATAATTYMYGTTVHYPDLDYPDTLKLTKCMQRMGLTIFGGCGNSWSRHLAFAKTHLDQTVWTVWPLCLYECCWLDTYIASFQKILTNRYVLEKPIFLTWGQWGNKVHAECRIPYSGLFSWGANFPLFLWFTHESRNFAPMENITDYNTHAYHWMH